ncbi:NAD(P)-dependent oxidoreductase [Pelagibius marinus]|uniref:NAD(P)-dependent oxidoreductase n=1 Tax=Pelagibius marinus TaxID=2762760 RepID=UPI0029CA01F1|nr:NAD(P)-dependent oxidoreductase [Pelagibius marinus]
MSGKGGAVAPPAAIGFIGLGQMGIPMAQQLLRAGFEVKAFDAAEAARANFQAATGTAAVESAAAACRDVAAVITMLPDGKIVRDVLCGAGEGALAAADPGTIVIDMSSSSPIDTRALAAALEPRGFALVDAPVSGGVKRALDGSLAIMAGGETGTVERVRPLLSAMGAAVFATGPLGSGHAMKALNNYVSAAGLVAAAEAILVGRRFGLDPETIVDVLNASTGRNNSTEKKMKQQVLSGDFASGFSLALMTKDLHTAAGIARDAGIAAPLAQVCEDLWAEADTKLGAGADHTEIYRFLAGLQGGDGEAS